MALKIIADDVAILCARRPYTVRVVETETIRADVQARWNGWALSGTELAFPHPDLLSIDLKCCSSPEAILCAIAQVVRTRHVTKKCISGLVLALDDTLDLKQTFCCGKWPTTKKEIVERLRQRHSQ